LEKFRKKKPLAPSRGRERGGRAAAEKSSRKKREKGLRRRDAKGLDEALQDLVQRGVPSRQKRGGVALTGKEARRQELEERRKDGPISRTKKERRSPRRHLTLSSAERRPHVVRRRRIKPAVCSATGTGNDTVWEKRKNVASARMKLPSHQGAAPLLIEAGKREEAPRYRRKKEEDHETQPKRGEIDDLFLTREPRSAPLEGEDQIRRGKQTT